MNHTSGPWEAKETLVFTQGGAWLSQSILQHVGYEQAFANTLLMAAAPDMLHALREIADARTLARAYIIAHKAINSIGNGPIGSAPPNPEPPAPFDNEPSTPKPPWNRA